MKRFHGLLVAFLVLAVSWFWACVAVQSSDSTGHMLKYFVLSLPATVLAIYGLYASILLVYGVCTFRTVPKEAAQLRAEIDEAHQFLRKRGVHVA
jgi:hypothetical protein